MLWNDIWAPERSKVLVQHWLPGLCAGLAKIPFGSWKRNLSDWLKVKGISEKKAREIAAQVTEKTEMAQGYDFLQKYGISLNLGAKIYQKYKDSLYTVLPGKSYRLAEDISGVGFKIAERLQPE